MSPNRWLVLMLTFAAASPATVAQQGTGTHALTPTEETTLALSACPVAVAGKAAVYLLGSSGFIKVRDGQNGFSAIVEHSRPSTQEPQCMDAEGTRTVLPKILKIAELRTKGKTEDEISRFVADSFKSGLFEAPHRPGVDYMLSTENIVLDPEGRLIHFPPHVMFYAPYLTNADLGSDGSPTSTLFVVEPGSPHALVIVPVGTAAGHVHPSAGGSSLVGSD